MIAKTRWPADGGLFLGQVLLLAVFVTVLLSTTGSLIVECAAYLAFVTLPELRRRLWDVMRRHPVFLATIPFGIVLVVGVFYGHAPWSESLKGLLGWRRMWLLPLVLAVFTDVPSRRLALRVVVVTCVVGSFISFVTEAAWISLSERLDPGIVFHNYSTQGMVLSLAAIICIAAILRPREFAGDRLLGRPWLMVAVLAVVLFDIVFVLWSRTGYLSALVMSVSAAALLAPGTWRLKLATGAAILLACVAIMVASPHVRGRLEQARSEIVAVDQAPVGTRIGTRIVMWRNTYRMILDHPVFGVGTGGFQSGYAPYVQGVSGWRGNLTDDPHNQFLKLLGETRILGLGTFLFFLYVAFRHSAPTPYRELAVAALIGWCATSLANSDFSTQSEGRLIYLWLGITLADASVAMTRRDAASG